MNGETETGVSVIEISKRKFDAGSILLQKSLKVTNDDTYISLAKKLASLGGDALLEVLDNGIISLEDHRRNALVQQLGQVTYAPLVTREDHGILQVDKLSSS